VNFTSNPTRSYSLRIHHGLNDYTPLAPWDSASHPRDTGIAIMLICCVDTAKIKAPELGLGLQL
jgi:hypothetical protein